MNRLLSENDLKSLNLFEWNFFKNRKPLLPFFERISINIVNDSALREEQLRMGVADVIANASHTDIINFANDKKNHMASNYLLYNIFPSPINLKILSGF